MTRPTPEELRSIEFAANAIMAFAAPLLAGQEASVQGAIIADLTARWLAGHPPQLRESVLQLHIVGVRALIGPNEKQLFGDAGHPARRQSPTNQI